MRLLYLPSRATARRARYLVIAHLSGRHGILTLGRALSIVNRTDYLYRSGVSRRVWCWMPTNMDAVCYTEARDHLADLWDRAVENRETIRLTRRGVAPVVLLAADEYDGLLETAHLLRSPANAARLLSALERARASEDTPRPLDELRAELDRAEET